MLVTATFPTASSHYCAMLWQLREVESGVLKVAAEKVSAEMAAMAAFFA